MANSNFDEILATTLKHYSKNLQDNFFKKTPLLFELSKKGRIRMVGGGQSIVEPIMYANGDAGAYGAWDQISIAPVDTASAAEYPWRQLYASIAISGIEEAQNSSKEAIINLLEAKIMQAEKTLKQLLNSSLFGDGTGNSGKDFLGLEALIGDETSSVTTVGGIDATTATYWRSPVFAPAELTLGAVKHAINSASDGADGPKFLVTTQDLYEALEDLMSQQVQYEDVEAANAGFKTITVQGIPCYWDRDCTADTMYGVDTDTLKLVGHSQRWMKQSPFSQNLASAHATSGASNVVDARYSLITCYGNLVTNERRRNFKLTVTPEEEGGVVG